MSRQLSSFCTDWLSVFPHLQRFKGGRKLLLRTGTIVYGIELRKIFDDTYRPEFICLNLLSPYNEFSLTREVDLPRNPQGDINHKHHARDFQTAAQTMKERISVLVKRDPKPSDVVGVYRQHIEHDIERGPSQVALMTSLIQQSVYFDLADVEAIERRRLKVYCESLPSEVMRSLDATIASEISMTVEQLTKTMDLNVAKAGWPENTEQTEGAAANP